ncbi:hypothetical protein, partial [Caballeronia sp. INML3]|uniref:hypothetical protein n=1 Tax=Caballeronia sp. INML3 TaxID=2921752 RepID=UPI002032A4BB
LAVLALVGWQGTTDADAPKQTPASRIQLDSPQHAARYFEPSATIPFLMRRFIAVRRRVVNRSAVFLNGDGLSRELITESPLHPNR